MKSDRTFSSFKTLPYIYRIAGHRSPSQSIRNQALDAGTEFAATPPSWLLQFFTFMAVHLSTLDSDRPMLAEQLRPATHRLPPIRNPRWHHRERGMGRKLNRKDWLRSTRPATNNNLESVWLENFYIGPPHYSILRRIDVRQLLI